MNMKPSNSKPEFIEFLRGGGCKEAVMAMIEGIREDEENEKDIINKVIEGTSMLNKCMEAHSDYYQPILAVQKSKDERRSNEFVYIMDADLMTKVEGWDHNASSDVEKFGLYREFMEGGGCKESFMACLDCVSKEEEEEETYGDNPERCEQITLKLLDCTNAHSDYYPPLVGAWYTALKTVEDQITKEFHDMFSFST